MKDQSRVFSDQYRGIVRQIAWSQDGRLLAETTDSQIAVFEDAGWKVVRNRQVSGYTLAFADNNHLAYSDGASVNILKIASKKD